MGLSLHFQSEEYKEGNDQTYRRNEHNPIKNKGIKGENGTRRRGQQKRKKKRQKERKSFPMNDCDIGKHGLL